MNQHFRRWYRIVRPCLAACQWLAVGLALAGTAVIPAAAVAQIPEPARPEAVEVHIRYRIRTERDQRIVQYRGLMRYLESLGFVDARRDDPNRDLDALDPAAERLRGRIPAAKVLKILQHPAVRTILFAPADYAYPAADEPVPVRIVIRDGLTRAAQQLLYRQVLQRLQLLGFEEFLGYDHRNWTQIKGQVPVRVLPVLMRDLRDEPSGWFLSYLPRSEMPVPLVDDNPVRWVEVLPPATPPQRATPPAVKPAESKMTPGLRTALADPAAAGTAAATGWLIEAVYPVPMEDQIQELQRRLTGWFGPPQITSERILPAVSVEGVVGPVVTLRLLKPEYIATFAAGEPDVLTLRLPQRATVTNVPGSRAAQAVPFEKWIAESRIAELQSRGWTGKGVKIVLVTTDVRGLAEAIGQSLPRDVRLIDLTRASDPELRPQPIVQDDTGDGLAAAQTIKAIAPQAELVIVRTERHASYRIAELRQWMTQPEYVAPAWRNRRQEIDARVQRAIERKERAIARRQKALESLATDETARKELQQSLAEVAAAEAALQQSLELQSRIRLAIQELRQYLAGADIVVNTLAWDVGYPQDGVSPLTMELERLVLRRSQHLRPVRPTRGATSQPSRRPLWLQAASAADGAIWSGLYRDRDADGLLDFAPPDRPLPPGHWSPNMNFLAWQQASGERIATLPAGTAIRITLQWREPLAPSVTDYRQPLFPFAIHLWRQIDPSGTKQAADEMTETARTAYEPYIVQVLERAIVYEQILDAKIPEQGRYAVLVSLSEGRRIGLQSIQKESELYMRLVIETTPGSAAGGQVVFGSFWHPAAGVGMPGDAVGVVTIGGAAKWQLQAGGPGIPLRRKPDYLMPDVLRLGTTAYDGTSLGTAAAAGLAALLLEAGFPPDDPFAAIGMPPAQLLRLTPDQLERFPRKP